MSFPVPCTTCVLRGAIFGERPNVNRTSRQRAVEVLAKDLQPEGGEEFN